MRIDWRLGRLALLFVALMPALGQADDEGESTKNPGMGIRGLIDEYNQAYQAFITEYSGAKTDEERQKLVTEKMPKPDQFGRKILDLARNNPDDPVSLDGMVWILSYIGEPEPTAEAFKLIAAHHVKSERLKDLCLVLSNFLAPEAEDLMRAVVAQNPHHEVQGWAWFSIAQQLKRRREIVVVVANQPEMKDRVASFYGEDLVRRITKTDAQKLDAEMELIMERIANDFADVSGGTLGKSAERELFEIKHLSLGKTAPEIEGEDIDGVPFKLSDYRGKVVVLDFWGDW